MDKQSGLLLSYLRVLELARASRDCQECLDKTRTVLADKVATNVTLPRSRIRTHGPRHLRWSCVAREAMAFRGLWIRRLTARQDPCQTKQPAQTGRRLAMAEIGLDATPHKLDSIHLIALFASVVG